MQSLEDTTLLIFATRYALGRRSYVPGLMKDLILARRESMNPADVNQIKREVEEYLVWNEDDDPNARVWQDLVAQLEQDRDS